MFRVLLHQACAHSGLPHDLHEIQGSPTQSYGKKAVSRSSSRNYNAYKVSVARAWLTPLIQDTIHDIIQCSDLRRAPSICYITSAVSEIKPRSTLISADPAPLCRSAVMCSLYTITLVVSLSPPLPLATHFPAYTYGEGGAPQPTVSSPVPLDRPPIPS